MNATLFDTDEPKMTTTAIAPWFGSNRMLGPEVAKLLRGCKWIGIPFGGGMSEVAHIKASTIVVSDLHRHVINLCRVVQGHRETLCRELDELPFHPDELRDAQQRCRGWELDEHLGFEANVEAARSYFAAVWMGRSHKSGIDDEFNGGLSVRWNANGGDSNRRYRSAVESLAAWEVVMKRCNFVVMDAFDFLERCEDEDAHGVYADPPFPGPGDRYKHNCGDTEQEQVAWHTRLRDALIRFEKTSVVCRFYDHPLIRELYPEPRWKWHFLEGRKQSNEKAPEVLLVNH